MSTTAGPRASATRDRLYRAATELFVERGYEDTTMAAIAERARASRRTAFNHFPSKGDIPMLWVRQMADLALDAVADKDCDTAERIRRYFGVLCAGVEGTPELSRQMMYGWTAAAGPIRYESQLLIDLKALLEPEAGYREVQSDRDAVAALLSDAFMGAVFRWVREEHQARPLTPVMNVIVTTVLE